MHTVILNPGDWIHSNLKNELMELFIASYQQQYPNYPQMLLFHKNFNHLCLKSTLIMIKDEDKTVAFAFVESNDKFIDKVTQKPLVQIIRCIAFEHPVYTSESIKKCKNILINLINEVVKHFDNAIVYYYTHITNTHMYYLFETLQINITGANFPDDTIDKLFADDTTPEEYLDSQWCCVGPIPNKIIDTSDKKITSIIYIDPTDIIKDNFAHNILDLKMFKNYEHMAIYETDSDRSDLLEFIHTLTQIGVNEIMIFFEMNGSVSPDILRDQILAKCTVIKQEHFASLGTYREYHYFIIKPE